MNIINDRNEAREKITKKEKVLIDFYATWCGPCKMLSPILEQLENKIEYDIIKLDIDENEDLAKQYGVMVVPTLIVLDNGMEISRKTGLLSIEQLEEWLEINK